jgi:hypothetical protein
MPPSQSLNSSTKTNPAMHSDSDLPKPFPYAKPSSSPASLRDLKSPQHIPSPMSRMPLASTFSFLRKSNYLDILFLIFGLIGIIGCPIFDFQAIFPTYMYPQFLLDMHAHYCYLVKDPFMCRPKLWFQGIVLAELLVQIPLLIVLVRKIIKHDKSQLYYVALLAYGVHAATTLIPILTEIVFNEVVHNRLGLFLLYLPFFAVPAAMAVDGAKNLLKRVREPHMIRSR